MPYNSQFNIQPNDDKAFDQPSIRKKWIQNLINLLHTCLLNGEITRAKRAWSILVRCREVNWKSRWYWGLLILSHDISFTLNEVNEATQPIAFSQNYGDKSKDIERWLNSLRVFAKEEDKPSLLHALILHLIKSGQYRQAYDQLETWLSSYPYLLSGPLHTYAGLLSFYLAQPPSARIENQISNDDRSSSTSPSPSFAQQVDIGGLRQARGWFAKALEIDETDQIAIQFISIIDNPSQGKHYSEDESDLEDSKNHPSSDSDSELDEKLEEYDSSDSDLEIENVDYKESDEELISDEQEKADNSDHQSISGQSWSDDYSDSYGN
ncbi:uncharacterized protein I206_106462 [Kwoniella pini CBS 10737]|uniref:Uncharacterized protein n=1 Tax=Kwoniella pini CBS 10737 TaxID=1296096 RepID=A0A1B9HUE2_9TREE|nr:uncharacterized protein I206_07267 [Kwoniella pini CBS 10737]OCF46880.1 hypothetical protein I206_07267 [Kwoniella pini CBS 10737]